MAEVRAWPVTALDGERVVAALAEERLYAAHAIDLVPAVDLRLVAMARRAAAAPKGGKSKDKGKVAPDAAAAEAMARRRAGPHGAMRVAARAMGFGAAPMMQIAAAMGGAAAVADEDEEDDEADDDDDDDDEDGAAAAMAVPAVPFGWGGGPAFAMPAQPFRF